MAGCDCPAAPRAGGAGPHQRGHVGDQLHGPPAADPACQPLRHREHGGSPAAVRPGQLQLQGAVLPAAAPGQAGGGAVP
ncbi:MAG: hypothetical protein EBU53_05015 [Proteobacteria bacterium]|nr:hypothetical protein [Pseudomonadota bacterium]